MMYQFLMVKNYLNSLATAIVREEEGQGMAEYGLILVLISIAAIALMGGLGGQIGATFGEVTGELVP